MEATQGVDDRAALEFPHPYAPGTVFNGLTVILVGWTLWAYSAPDGAFFETIGLFWLWVLLGLVWIATLIRQARNLWKGRQARLVARWLIAPMLALGSAASVASEAPLVLRFEASEGSLNSLVEDVLSRPAGTIVASKRVGLYRASEIERTPWGVRFITGDCFLDTCGLAFSPDHPPTNVGGEDSYAHFRGDWYFYHHSW
jgi:hypothetical protein